MRVRSGIVVFCFMATSCLWNEKYPIVKQVTKSQNAPDPSRNTIDARDIAARAA
jgi:hypothetical protein